MNKEFKSLRDIANYLDSLGYKLSKSKVGRDLKERGIKKNSDGIYPGKAVLEYAATLERKGDAGLGPAELQAQKAAMEIDLLGLKTAKFEFEIDREKGKYILKKDFDAELAARAVVLDSGFRHFFATRAREMIVTVGGKIDKTADLLELLNQGLNEQLNVYASQDVFQVLFEQEFS